MGKFLVRLLLFLILAAGTAYLLFPIGADQSLLYGNAPLLQTYRQYAAGLDSASTARTKDALTAWNNRQLQAGIVPIEVPDPGILANSQNPADGQTESLAGGMPQQNHDVWSTLLNAANGAVTRQMISQTLDKFLLAGGIIQPLRVQDPFAAGSDAASSLLAADRDGVAGILEIPKLGVTLPVYGERTQAHLDSGLFYGPGSSLPIGGGGTHALLAGLERLDTPEALRGVQQTVRRIVPAFHLDGPKMLEDMNQLKSGDLFLFSILDQTLIYQIDRVDTAPPEQTIMLERTISNAQMTILSATRDGGRLIVHGKRVGPDESAEKILEENAASIPPYWINVLTFAAPLMAFGLLVMFIVECVKHRRYQLPKELTRKNLQ